MKKALSIFILILTLAYTSRSKEQTGIQAFSDSEKTVSDTLIIDTSVTVNSSATPYSGDLNYKAMWKDELGTNVFIISNILEYRGGEGKTELFAYHYVKKKNHWNLLWKTYDFVEGHGCDLNILPLKEFIRITDLDKNNIAETSYLYKLDNRCDAVVVPAKMIVHIGKNKYSIRGFADLQLGPPEDLMNKYLKEEGKKEVKYKEFDTDFNKLPDVIENYYSNLWDTFSK